MAGDLSLPEESAFVVRVIHTAVRQDNVAVAGDDDDNTLLFTGTFQQSDEVDFETGSSPPICPACSRRAAVLRPTTSGGCASRIGTPSWACLPRASIS